MFEQRTGRAWISRYCRTELRGSGGHTLDLAGWNVRTADGETLHRPGKTWDVRNIIAAWPAMRM